MSADGPQFQRGVIRPIECWSAGWQNIKDQYWLLVGMSAVGILLGSLAPMGILMGPAMCGMYITLLTMARGERVEFGHLFKGFDYFVPSLIATLVQMVPIFALMIPCWFVMMFIFVGAGVLGAHHGGDGGAPAFGIMLGGIALVVLLVATVTIALGAFFMFTYPLIVDRKLSGWDACKTSARAVRGNLGGVLGLVLLNFGAGIAGMLLCYVGAFLLMPLGFAAIAVAYRQVFPDQGAPLTIAANPPVQTSG
jgi:hypothetical protein